MKIIAVDNEIPALNILTRAISEARPDAQLRTFHRTSDAIHAIRDEGFHPDVAFLDIEMPGMTGLELPRSSRSPIPASTSSLSLVFPNMPWMPWPCAPAAIS